MNRYFQVTAKCGHVSKGHYIDKAFAIIAESASSAAQAVKYFPRVKKHLKNAITSCIEIDYDDFKQLKVQMHNDGYFHSKNRREQMERCPEIQNEIKPLTLKMKPHKEPQFEYRYKKEYENFRSILLHDLFETGILPSIVKI